MTKRNFFLLSISAASLLFFGWQASKAAKDDVKPQTDEVRASIEATKKLGGDSRYLTFISTDKPIYRPGETLFIRGVMLHHADRTPLPEDAKVFSTIQILGPKGDVIAGGRVGTEDSVIGFSWEIPDSMPGGEYKAKMTFPETGYAPAIRKFDVRAYRAPRLKNQIKFVRDGYGPGDTVVARLHTERAEGGIPVGARVSVTARVDGIEVHRGPAMVNEAGNCIARFALPAQISRGMGTLAMAIEDGGVVETATKTIPILLQTVDLNMYPEGGDLVADLPNRVYFEAFTPAKKPADLAGIIVDADGKQVAKFRSEHEGRGRFTLTPKAGTTYQLKITEPSGINTTYDLPAAKSNGVVLRADQDRFTHEQPVALSIGATKQFDHIRVTLSQREREIAARKVDAASSNQDLTKIEFTELSESATGVLVATVWGADNKPLAERLIYRSPLHQVNVKVTADNEQYTPGGKARLKVTATDEEGRPVNAVVGISVTDDSVLEMVDKRDQAPRLPVMVLLEGEVRELADAHVYLDESNPKSGLAVDLLLGTQGWRRFAFVDTQKFLAANGDKARRVLGLRMSTQRELLERFTREHARRFAAPMRGRAWQQRALRRDGLPVPKSKAVPRPDAHPVAEAPREKVAAVAPAPPKVEAAAKPDVAFGAFRPSPVIEEDGDRQELREALQQAEAQVADEALLVPDIGNQALRNDFVSVRIYAHQVRSGRTVGERVDFTETLFWHAGIRTGDDGVADFEFDLNDSITSFKVSADAFSNGGAIGGGSVKIESVEPFYVEPKLPLEVTVGDRILAPLGIVNATSTRLDGGKLSVRSDGSLAVAPGTGSLSVDPKQRKRQLIDIVATAATGEVPLTISGAVGPYADQVTRSLTVKPSGFPVELGHGGLIGPGDTVSHEITIPVDLVPGSVRTKAVVYPTPLASMTQALERLIREPGGCFEQTSSTTYPLVMAQQYFMSHQGVDPTLIERSSQILERGYNRLIGFESKSGGFEWFGGDPGHDALTAYGLLEFTDMAQVRYVDPEMLARTREWLLSQRDGKGGFARKTRTLHTWLAEPEIANAYNTWALLTAGTKADLSTEAKWVAVAAKSTENSYVMALAANVAVLAGDKETEEQLLDKLAGKQTEDGSLTGATRSVVGSGGVALKIETTSLAVLAWLHNPHYVANVEKGIKFLAESCKAGRFGSTQSTILALRAIVAYDQSRATPKAAGELTLFVDGKPVADVVSFDKDEQGAIELPQLDSLLSPGKHQIQVKMKGGSKMPYSLAIDFNRLQPASSEDCQLHLETQLADKAVQEGDVTEANVVVVNRSNEDQPNPVAIVGIPAGLEVRHDQLKELVKAGTIAAYEVLGREVVLYWRVLEAEQRVELPLSLLAAIPGEYSAPASRAYLYYTDEHKHWVEAFQVKVTPKQFAAAD